MVKLWQNMKFFERDSKYPDTFFQELNYQCSKVSLPLSFLASVSWLPYIPLDMQLHPDKPLIIYLRLGMVSIGLSILILHLLKNFRKQGILILSIIGFYLEIAAAVITAFSGGQSHYIGGYLFLLMLIPLVPLPSKIQILMLVSNLFAFFSVGYLQGITFGSYEARYSLNDIAATSLVSLAFIFLLGKMRYHSWQASKGIEHRNQVLENELKLARRIQTQLIPSESTNRNLAFFYKPMDLLGGDFYDVIRFRDRNSLGIFISDVSGHGVPAAFITAMIKTLILNSGNHKVDPAALLYFLNDVLINLSGGNFITAFYGLFDLDRRFLTFANAGHNPPYLLNGDRLTEIKGNGGPPLAFLPSTELKNKGKPYENNEIYLSKNDRLLFYTDGLTEARTMNQDEEMFGTNRLEKEIQSHKNESPQSFVSGLYQSLVEFRGSENFEDDVCIICMDIQ